MTDDSKEYRFNTAIRWLKEADFTIAEEKHTIVTSDFYAKIFSSEKSLPAIELSSSPSLGNGILFQIILSNLKDRFPNLSMGELKNKLECDNRVNELLTRNETFLSNNDQEIKIQKVYSFDPQRTESKFEIMSIVSDLQLLTKNIKEWIDLNMTK